MKVASNRRECVSNMARMVAERELRMLRQALASDDPAIAAQRAISEFSYWLQYLLGRPLADLRPYIYRRREMVRRFGVLPDACFLLIAQSCLSSLITEGEDANAA